jgi:predicted metal-dependent hydrolase
MLKGRLADKVWALFHQKAFLLDNLNIVSKHSPRAKRLSLRVNPKKGVIELVIPPRTRQFSIDRFVNDNLDWINEKKQFLPRKQNIADGQNILFQGRKIRLNIQKIKQRQTDIGYHNGTINIRTPRDDVTNNFKRWIIEQAKQAIISLAHKKAKRIHREIEKIDFRDPATRWGSCSSSGRLMFSWRLIMAPDSVLDYVVAHEVAHLAHMNHSKVFWELCYDLVEPKYDPNECRLWLKDHGNSLLNIF